MRRIKGSDVAFYIAHMLPFYTNGRNLEGFIFEDREGFKTYCVNSYGSNILEVNYINRGVISFNETKRSKTTSKAQNIIKTIICTQEYADLYDNNDKFIRG
jgi:hypothetical protein